MRGVLVALALATSAWATDDPRQDASTQTKASNAAVLEALPFDDENDFELAERGFIGKPESTIILDSTGKVVWSMEQFGFESGDAPSTVNPSLWRQAQLNNRHGLFKVADGIYQVRGFDLSNLSVIEGETGYIVVDPLITREVAKAAMDLVFEHLPIKPVVAVIYSHSHADHFGGVKGVVSEADVESGKVRIIASEGFMEFAVSENVLAGNVMTRRASYMFGSLLPKDEKGGVGVGLGKAISSGEVTLIEPTDIIVETGDELVIDGLRFVFMNTPFAEAPAELMFLLPDKKAFYAAEEANATLHNLYTLRGAQVRDALLWSGYLHEAADLIDPDTEVLFGGHHWPRWGYDNIIEYLRKQGDLYKYIHDQTLRLANHGLTMDEISEELVLPPELGRAWYNRGYYGSVSHNVRAVYQKYLGFFDGNPAHMHPLPPEEAGRKYVEFMGGADKLLANAQAAYDDGEYRWVAEVVNHLVFAEPDHEAARKLQAAALEQLGYQSESGQWRNFYLTGAQELRSGVARAGTTRTLSPDMLAGLSNSDLLDYLAVRLNGPRAAGKSSRIHLAFLDSGEEYLLTLENGVLRHHRGESGDADVSLKLTRQGFLAMGMLGQPVRALLEQGVVAADGNLSAVDDLVGLLDNFEFWFDIVTP